MKNLVRTFVIAFVSICVLSCSKDDDNIAPGSGVELSSSLKRNLVKYGKIESDSKTNLISVIMGGKDCFTVSYPASFTNDQNSDVKTVNNDLEFSELLFSFGTTTAALQVQYPINITRKDKTKMTVDSQKDLDALVNTCNAEACNNCEKNCFALVYPITFIKGNGTVTKINNADEGIAFLGGLKEKELITLSYPINVVSKGTQTKVNSDKELEDLFAKCFK